MKNNKIQHLVAGAAVAVIVGLIPYLESNVLFDGIWSAVTSAAIAGCTKEFADNAHGYRFDGIDVLATFIGGIVVVLLILGLHFGKG